MVHDPLVGETFSAISGEAAFRDGAPVTASHRRRLDEALPGLTFDPSSVHQATHGPVVATLLPDVGDIRRIPAALHLAYLASGRFDCGMLVGARLWDVAAGLLLAREAGVVLGGVDTHRPDRVDPRLPRGCGGSSPAATRPSTPLGRVAAAVPRLAG